jgi:tRNA threonylcarbamoyl adenosine modification protein YeaZ
LIVGVETSASLCSLCFLENGEVIAYEEADIGMGHASVLFDLLARAEKTSGRSLKAATHLAVTRGPGSFTGIRVGLAFATGVSLANSLPILGLTCFDVAAYKLKKERFIGIAFDTKRQDFYSAFYKEGKCLEMGVWSLEEVLEKKDQWGIDRLWTDVPDSLPSAHLLRLNAKDVAEAVGFYATTNPTLFSAEPFYLRPPKVYE